MPELPEAPARPERLDLDDRARTRGRWGVALAIAVTTAVGAAILLNAADAERDALLEARARLTANALAEAQLAHHEQTGAWQPCPDLSACAQGLGFQAADYAVPRYTFKVVSTTRGAEVVATPDAPGLAAFTLKLPSEILPGGDVRR